MKKMRGVGQLALASADPLRVAEFYESAFGFKRRAADETGVDLELAGFELSFRRAEKPNRDGLQIGFRLDTAGDVDAWAQELTQRGFPGHEKFLPAPWTAARLTEDALEESDLPFPKLLVFGGQEPVERPEGVTFEEWVATARATLECGEVESLQRSISDSLTRVRFVDNVFESFGNTSLRIPPEPGAAQRRFC